jgi:hypothetical protein
LRVAGQLALPARVVFYLGAVISARVVRGLQPAGTKE